MPIFPLSSAQHMSSWSVLCGLSEPLALPLQYSPLHYYPILQTLQTITGHKIAPTEAFLSPILVLRGVSRAILSSCMPLLFQLSAHGRRPTSTRLLKTVSTDRHKERGVNTLTRWRTFPQLKQYPANGNTWMSGRTADNRCCVATGWGLLAALPHTY